MFVVPTHPPVIKPRRILKWGSILPLTNIRLNSLAQRYGIKCNKLGLVLDALIDSLDSFEGLAIQAPNRQGAGSCAKFSAVEIRAIRKSKEKIIVLAHENSVSERWIRMIRSRAVYKWVK